MTEKLYYDDQYLKEFDAVVLSCKKAENGKYNILLDKTVFFPEGGGQDADSGFLNEIFVEYVFEENGDIFHICNSPLKEGEAVHGKIDFDKRFLLMQKHSGEHVFSGVIHSLYGLENVGFHMGHECITVDFDKMLSAEEIKKAEEITNRIIWENRKITSSFPTREEAEKINFRSKKEISGQIRLVTIENCDVCACCGTHTSRTGEAGTVKVVSVSKKRSGVSIGLQIGKDAFEDYSQKHREITEISNLLALKPLECADGVKKLKEEIASLKYEMQKMKLDTFSEKIKDVSGKLYIVFEKNLQPDEVRKMCDLLADKVDIAAVFSGDDRCGYKYTLASRKSDLRQLAKDFNSSLSGKGGGKPEMVQGTVNESREKIENFLRGVVL